VTFVLADAIAPVASVTVTLNAYEPSGNVTATLAAVPRGATSSTSKPAVRVH
jgi:hypothetical protein